RPAVGGRPAGAGPPGREPGPDPRRRPPGLAGPPAERPRILRRAAGEVLAPGGPGAARSDVRSLTRGGEGGAGPDVGGRPYDAWRPPPARCAGPHPRDPT